MTVKIEVVASTCDIAQKWAEQNEAVVKSCEYIRNVRRWHDLVFDVNQRTDLGCIQGVYRLHVEGGDFEENAQYIPNRSEIFFLGGERIA